MFDCSDAPDFVRRAIEILSEQEEKYVVAWHLGNGKFEGVGYWDKQTGQFTKNVTPDIRKYCCVLEGYIEAKYGIRR